MTISSSLNASVAGLNANATKLATISDNLANSSTYGYKRSEAEFHSLVIDGSSAFSAGGVRTTTHRLIDERGPLVTTGNSTDIAISGRGMIPVTESVALDNGDDFPMYLMTTASFYPDENGVLTTDTGFVLLGWPVESDGTVPNYPRDTMEGLEPVHFRHAGVEQDDGVARREGEAHRVGRGHEEGVVGVDRGRGRGRGDVACDGVTVRVGGLGVVGRGLALRGVVAVLARRVDLAVGFGVVFLLDVRRGSGGL